MAYEIDGPVKFSMIANADLSAKQYYAVKLVSGPKVDVCSATTDVPCGILQNNPTSGKIAEVTVVGISKVNSDAALAIGNLIGTAVDGQLAAYTPGTDTTKYVIGQVILASSAAAEIATALINAANPHRAA